MDMFCNQCQEASKGIGCTIIGVCGKSPELSALMDTFIYSLVGLSSLAIEVKKLGYETNEVDLFVTEGLFATITNANFDEEEFVYRIEESVTLRNKLKDLVEDQNLPILKHDVVNFKVSDKQTMIAKALSVAIHSVTEDEDIRSLRELILFGLKGLAAYASHAEKLGYLNDEIFNAMHQFMASLISKELDVAAYTAMALELGKVGVSAMALLDQANTSSFGHPEMTKVNIGVGKNPGILITGHDLHDMKQLLDQTMDKGIDIYTHSEMLPAHYYPELKKYPHLFGNYGNAWHEQTKEFETFNGPIVFTTNCLVPPRKNCTYTDRVYTTGNTGHPDFKVIPVLEDGSKDFSSVIEHALTCTKPTEIEKGEIIGGFAHNQVLSLADSVVGAIKDGDIKNFVVMGGCDGRHKERTYYKDFAQQLPNDAVILTAGCAKYKYNKLNLGNINGIPRVLDAGQCNDSYSLVVIALKLKEALGLEDINDLPISYNIAWYEQKAVIVLLSLLYLGVKNIHLGPTLPAFISPNVLKVLVENFSVAGITTVENDLQTLLK
ncbi:MAG TPA: hydroxylamine reductase [Firmicutes bacterium]|nr:hydroxylamine reductase [Bacillota bacterium]